MSHAGLAMHNAHVGYAAVATNMEVTQEHVSAGCNRVVGALDWGDHLVAYAAHNLVCLYDAEVGSKLCCLEMVVLHLETPKVSRFCFCA